MTDKPRRFRAPPPGSLSTRGHVPIGDLITSMATKLEAAAEKARSEPRRPRQKLKSELAAEEVENRKEFYVIVVKLREGRFRAETVEPVYGSPLFAYGTEARIATQMLHWEYAKRLAASGAVKDWDQCRAVAARTVFIPNEVVTSAPARVGA